MINEVIKDLNQVAANLDVIVFDSDPVAHVQTIHALFERLRKHNLKLSPAKALLGATVANFLGHSISPAGQRPNANCVRIGQYADAHGCEAGPCTDGWYQLLSQNFARLVQEAPSDYLASSHSRPLWENWCEKSWRSLRLRRFCFFPLGALSPTAHVHSTCTATLASTGLAPPTGRNRRTVP